MRSRMIFVKGPHHAQAMPSRQGGACRAVPAHPRFDENAGIAARKIDDFNETPVVTTKHLFKVVTKMTKLLYNRQHNLMSGIKTSAHIFSSRLTLYPIPVPHPEGNPARLGIHAMIRLALEHTA